LFVTMSSAPSSTPLLVALSIFTVGLICGTGSTVTIKVVYGLSSIGNDGLTVPFEKPLSTTWVMFLAMSFSLPLHFLCRFFFGRSPGEEVQTFVVNGKTVTRPAATPTKVYFMVIIPAVFDLIATALAKVGLMYTSTSVYQLVRSSVIIFTALFNILLLKKTVRSFQWLGIATITISMILISSSSLLDSNAEKASTANNDNPLLGILLLLASSVVVALQYVFEEKVMAGDGSAPPLLLVGMEGVWGTVLMWGCVFPWAYILPGSDKGSLENVFDSWTMLKNNPTIQLVLFGFFITVAIYNICGILITKLGSSMWHTILDNFRPVSVWITQLLLFYVFTHKTFGEAWTNCSYVEAAGLGVLLLGTAIYQGKIQIKGLSYEEVPEHDAMPICTPQFGPSPMVSPSLRYTHGDLMYARSPAPTGLLPTVRPQDNGEDLKSALLYFVPESTQSDVVANSEEAPQIA